MAEVEVKQKRKNKSMDYQNGKIYMLEPKCEYEDGEVYYGSTTTTLCKRLNWHKTKSNNCKSKILYEKYGSDNIKIVLIKNYPCNSIDELNAEEGKYHRQYKCVNKRIEGRSRAEYYQDHKEDIIENQKQYYQDHKDKLCENQKEYYQDNKELISIKAKEYNKTHKEEISEKKKKYYEDNKDKLCEKKKQYYKDKVKSSPQTYDIVKQKARDYYKANREKINAKRKQKYADLKEQSKQETKSVDVVADEIEKTE